MCPTEWEGNWSRSSLKSTKDVINANKLVNKFIRNWTVIRLCLIESL